jgi:hypothetical protein
MIARFAFATILVVALLAPPSASAAQRIKAKAWRAVKTYDMQTLQKVEPLPLRQVVALRFNYRQRDIRHLKPNWFYSSIWSANPSGELNSVPVMVSKADLAAFQRLPADPSSGGKFTVYGQVLRDADANYIFLRLLGTKVKRDARGNATVSW